MRKFYKNKKIIILILSLLYGLTFTGINASAMEKKENENETTSNNPLASPQNTTPVTATPQQTTISQQIQNMIEQMDTNNAELRQIIASLNSSSIATSQTKEGGETGSDSSQTSS